MLESYFSTKVIKALSKVFGGYWRKNPASAFASSGVADLIGCVDGQYIEVELKAPGKYKRVYLDGCTAIQRAHGQEINKFNGIWLCGDDLEQIIKDLSGLIRERKLYQLEHLAREAQVLLT